MTNPVSGNGANTQRHDLTTGVCQRTKAQLEAEMLAMLARARATAKLAKVEISTDGTKSWTEAQLNHPVHSNAQTRFQMDWNWDGQPTKIVSRSADENGNIQPDRASFIEQVGTKRQQRAADLEHRRRRDGSQCPAALLNFNGLLADDGEARSRKLANDQDAESRRAHP